MSNSNVLHTLSEVPLLSNCTKQQLTDLASRMTRRRFRRGDNLMKEGQNGDKFFIIVKGECKVFVYNKINEEQDFVAKLSIGDYCGEQALLSSNPRSATVTAITEVIALVVNRETFQDLIHEDFGITFAKRQAICAEELQEYHEEDNVDRNKSPIEKKWIWYTVSGNILFANLSTEQKHAVIAAMFKKTVNKRDYLIKEGESGDYFYVIRQGRFQISTKEKGLVKLACPGDCVGDLALLYNAPRAATVRCVSDGIVWCLHRGALRKAIMQETTKIAEQNIGFLKKVPILNSLLNSEIYKLNEAMEEVNFVKGDAIIKQGENGDRFYIIKDGEAKVIKKTDDGKEHSTILGIGDYFGEKAILRNDKRAATVVANTSNMTCLSLDRIKFNELLGNLEKLMNRNMKEYKKNLRLVQEERRKRSNERMSTLKFSKLEQLKVIGLLGRGGYGLVKLVKDPLTSKTFALKEVRKDKIVESQQTKHINDERTLMMQMDSPFLVNLWRTYQDEYKVYFLLDACLGGDLFTLLRKSHSFKESVAKFYAACVIEGFSHLHSMNMAYRDLKPENLVLDERGYVKITDFGFCTVVEGKTFTLCGTPDYLAPEIIMGRGHGIGVDYWTLGIFVYEMLGSMPPFYDREPSNIYRKIMRSKPLFPAYFSSAAKDLIKRLLRKRSTERLGCTAGGIDAIKQHPWFHGFDWNALRNRTMKSPYRPKLKSPEDISNFRCPQKKELPLRPIKDHSWAKDF